MNEIMGQVYTGILKNMNWMIGQWDQYMVVKLCEFRVVRVCHL